MNLLGPFFGDRGAGEANLVGECAPFLTGDVEVYKLVPVYFKVLLLRF